MNKKELIERLAEKGAFATKTQGEKVVNAILSEITESLAKGETVDLYGFGKFEVVERAARVGNNPKTGEKLTIEARKAPKFKASKMLKDIVAK